MTDRTPPPPGDLLAKAIPERLDLDWELGEWADRLHGRCRINNKFTGVGCDCGCHQARS